MTETPLTTVLRNAARDSDKLLTARLHGLGLSGPRLEMLATYAENPGITNTEAARLIGVSGQSGAFVTAGLAGSGWVGFAPSRVRAMPVTVTDEGIAVLDAAWDASRPVEKRLATLLGAAGIRRLRNTAQALADDTTAPRQEIRKSVEDPRHAQVGNAALGLHYRALAWTGDHHTDVVPKSVVRKWSSPQANLAARLVNAGMWKPEGDDGWRVR